MNVTYEFTATATCPVDAAVIDFAVKVVAPEPIPVEFLLDVSGRLTSTPVMQEPYTVALEKEIRLSGYDNVFVETVGTHTGVKITCVV